MGLVGLMGLMGLTGVEDVVDEEGVVGSEVVVTVDLGVVTLVGGLVGGLVGDLVGGLVGLLAAEVTPIGFKLLLSNKSISGIRIFFLLCEKISISVSLLSASLLSASIDSVILAYLFNNNFEVNKIMRNYSYHLPASKKL